MEHRLVGVWVIDLTKYRPLAVRNGERETQAPSTLLGPEGPGFAQPSGLDAALSRDELRTIPPVEPPAHAGRRRLNGDRTRPYLENCTVDASIFVAKLIRAHGGCLGTRSRRRT